MNALKILAWLWVATLLLARYDLAIGQVADAKLCLIEMLAATPVFLWLHARNRRKIR